MQTENRIQREMQQTRASLGEKLQSLEQKVTGAVGTVEDATTTVANTVEAVKDTMQEAKNTVEAVAETIQDGVQKVQDSLNIGAYVQEHPWWIMAGSVAAGFCVGTLLPSAAPPSNDSGSAPPPTNGGNYHLPTEPVAPAAAPKAEPSRWTPEIATLKGLALGALFGIGREMIAASVRAPIGQQVREFIDGVTRKVGGEPISTTAFAGLIPPKSTDQHSPL